MAKYGLIFLPYTRRPKNGDFEAPENATSRFLRAI